MAKAAGFKDAADQGWHQTYHVLKVDLQPETFLGISISYGVGGEISLSQEGYIEKMCATFLTDEQTSRRSEIYPHDVKGYDVHEDGPKSVTLNERELGKYNELIGSLGYAVFTRFEIQAELGYLRTRLKNANRPKT